MRTDAKIYAVIDDLNRRQAQILLLDALEHLTEMVQTSELKAAIRDQYENGIIDGVEILAAYDIEGT